MTNTQTHTHTAIKMTPATDITESAKIEWIYPMVNVQSSRRSKTFHSNRTRKMSREKKKTNWNCRKWDRSPELTLAQQFSLISWRLCERLACVPISFFISCSTNFNLKFEQFVSSYLLFFLLSSLFRIRFHCGSIWTHHLWNDFQVLWLLKFKSLFPSSLSSSIVSLCIWVCFSHRWKTDSPMKRKTNDDMKKKRTIISLNATHRRRNQ